MIKTHRLDFRNSATAPTLRLTYSGEGASLCSPVMGLNPASPRAACRALSARMGAVEGRPWGALQTGQGTSMTGVRLQQVSQPPLHGPPLPGYTVHRKKSQETRHVGASTCGACVSVLQPPSPGVGKCTHQTPSSQDSTHLMGLEDAIFFSATSGDAGILNSDKMGSNKPSDACTWVFPRPRSALRKVIRINVCVQRCQLVSPWMGLVLTWCNDDRSACIISRFEFPVNAQLCVTAHVPALA